MTKVIYPTKEDIRRGAALGAAEHLVHDAASVRVSVAKHAVVFKMVSGVEISVPIKSIHYLCRYPISKLKTLRLMAMGEAVELPGEDLHLLVIGIIRDAFGLDWMSRGGQAKTEKKAAAARKNGAKGGRPARRKRAAA